MKKSAKKGLRIVGIIICVIILILALVSGLLFGGVFTHKPGGQNAVCKVLQITDVHILNNENKDQKAFNTITQMIEASDPDVIIVTGDITSEDENMQAFETFGSFLESFKIPWGFVYGNHDAEDRRTHTKTQLSEYLESLEYCFFERGPEDVDGEGNYYYNITDDSGKVIMSLIMMDSNMYYYDPALGKDDGYDCFHENQIQWYADTVKSIAKEVNGDENKVIPSLAFFHIPMREYVTGYEEAKANGNILDGVKFEQVYCSNHDDEMFETMQALGSTKGCFVGHDHMNNYTVDYQGIRLAYGYSCDHNIYLVPQKGGKLIYINEDGSFTQQGIYRWFGLGKLCYGKEF